MCVGVCACVCECVCVCVCVRVYSVSVRECEGAYVCVCSRMFTLSLFLPPSHPSPFPPSLLSLPPFRKFLTQELRSYRVTINVPPKFHPNIIGRKGATINKIRDDHDVRIQLPDKDSPNEDEIVIMGYEHQVKAAQDDILKIVRDLVRVVLSLYGFTIYLCFRVGLKNICLDWLNRCQLILINVLARNVWAKGC